MKEQLLSVENLSGNKLFFSFISSLSSKLCRVSSDGSMLSTTGIKEKLTVSKGSEIEVSSNEYVHTTGNIWYHALLQENLAQSKRKKLSVRHLNPLSNEDYSPPLITTATHRLIRPLPPPDLSPDEDFEKGDMIDAAHKGGWWSGWVIKALCCQRFLVYLKFDPDVIEVERKDLRAHLVWKDEEWFRCEKRLLIESEFSAGTNVEVRTKVEPFGNIWAPAITIKENDEDGTLLVKYKTLSDEEDEWTKTSVPYSRIRPTPPPFGLRSFSLMENVDVLLESGWCPSVVSKVLCGDRYTVLLGQNKESKDFDQCMLRPSMEWKDGAWLGQERGSDREESLHADEETTGSTRIRVKLRSTRSSSGTMQNQKGSANDSVGMKVNVSTVKHRTLSVVHPIDSMQEELNHRESVNKRKRGRPPRMAGQTPDPIHNSVVETPRPKDSTMVLPFVKKSPCWKVLESMEIFKAVPQRPHFSPLIDCDEESREGDAIGAMVKFTTLLEKVSHIQVDDSVTAINRIKDCFLKLEKHGFDVTPPLSRLDKLLSIKESQTWALEELQVAEREITEQDNKRRKCDEDIEHVLKKIVELQRQEALLKEDKVTMDEEIARMQSHATVLDQKVQNVEQEFKETVTAPWY